MRTKLQRRVAGAGLVLAAWLGLAPVLTGSTQPIRARQAMVVSQDEIASAVGAEVMREGGNAVDAAVATAFALAVTYPTAGNIGGGRLPRLPAGGGRARRLRLPGDRAGRVVAHHVPPGRRVRPGAASQLASGGGGAGHRGGAAPRLDRAGQPAVGEAGRAGGAARPRRLRGVRRPRPVAGRGAAAHGPVLGLGRPVLEGRRALRGGRGAAPAGPRADPRAHRGGGPRRLLPRRDGGPRRARDGRQRRHHDPRRPRRLPRRPPRPDRGHVPRPRGALDAPHQLGGDRHHPDAEHPGARRPVGVGLRIGRHRPPDDRGDAARLRRPRAPPSATPRSTPRCPSGA